MKQQPVHVTQRPGETQPPLGGCVLKRQHRQNISDRLGPAAFRRLCVETGAPSRNCCSQPPAAFRRLCVETLVRRSASCSSIQPPLGGCVLKHYMAILLLGLVGQPPLGGCVLKPIPGTIPNNNAFQPPLGGCVLKPF